MYRKYLISGITVMTALLWMTLASFAATPLVDTAWVKANAGSQGIVFLDVRSRDAYRQGHVPSAIHSSYGGDQWRAQKGGINGMLPPTDHLEKLIGRLGIDNSTHVVILHGGVSAVETGIATRIYWTFKVLGHDTVSILNGGMRAWLKDRSNPLETSNVKATSKVFTARMNTRILATANDMKAAIGTNTTILDSRPTDQYLGINKSGSVTRHGTVPGAISIPGRWMTIDDKGTFRSSRALANIYAARNASTTGDSIVFCNTGHWASLGWFIDHELLGNKKSKMYDGSMAEWSRIPANEAPMNIRLNMN